MNFGEQIKTRRKDRSDIVRIKWNLLGIKIGGGLLALGILSLIASIWVPYSLESYCGIAFTTMMFCGVLIFLIVGIKNMVDLFRGKNQKTARWMAGGGLLMLVGILFYVLSLLTEMVSGYYGFIVMIMGIVLLVAGAVMAKQDTE